MLDALHRVDSPADQHGNDRIEGEKAELARQPDAKQLGKDAGHDRCDPDPDEKHSGRDDFRDQEQYAPDHPQPAGIDSFEEVHQPSTRGTPGSDARPDFFSGFASVGVLADPSPKTSFASSPMPPRVPIN